MPDLATVLYVFLSLFLGGLLKGVVGLGLPLVAMPLLSFAVPLKTAVALVLVPIFVTNTAQSFQDGLFKPTIRRFWPARVITRRTKGIRAMSAPTWGRVPWPSTMITSGGSLALYLSPRSEKLLHARRF